MKTKLTLFVTLLLTALIAITLVQLNGSDNANSATVDLNKTKIAINPESTKKVTTDDFAANKLVQPELNETESNQDPALPDNIEAWKQHIKTGNTVEDLLAASLITASTAKEKERYLQQAYDLDPTNSLINFIILEVCLEDQTLSICSLPYLSTLINNGVSDPVTLSSIAAVYYQNGDLILALQFVEQAAVSESKYLHALSTIKMLDQSATNFGLDRTLPQLLDYESHTFMAGIWTVGHINDICQEQTMMSVSNWKQSCINAANNIASNVADFPTASIVQIVEVRLSDLTEEELVAKYAKMKQQLTEQADRRDWLTREVMKKYGNDTKLSSELWDAYLNVFEQQGKDPARQFLLEKLLEE